MRVWLNIVGLIAISIPFIVVWLTPSGIISTVALAICALCGVIYLCFFIRKVSREIWVWLKPSISREQALEIARQECLRRGWPWHSVRIARKLNGYWVHTSVGYRWGGAVINVIS